MIHGYPTQYSGDVGVMLKSERYNFITHCFVGVKIGLSQLELGNRGGSHLIIRC
jgi:hypothetical protein